MASYTITGRDLRITTSQSIMEVTVKIEVYDDYNHYLDTIICGVISADFSISAESDVRRTCSLNLIPTKKVSTIIDEDGLIWLNRNIKIELGIKDLYTGEYVYYPQGTFLIMSSSSTYDETNNTLALSCSDWVAKLDGTRNGNLGQLAIVYPAYNDYFTSLWIETAKNEGVDTSNVYDLFKWAKDNPSDEYHNWLIDSNDDNVLNSVYRLMTQETLEQQDIDICMKQINKYIQNEWLKLGGEEKCPYLEYYEYRTIVSDEPIVIRAIREFIVIREAMMKCLGQLGYIKNRDIDEIGESKGMPYHFPNWDYMSYREKNTLWNKIPYDLEFSKGCTVWSIITTMRDLYEKYQCYFDVYNTFCCDLIPRGYDDPITFYDDFIQKILISENNTINFEEIKNVTEVWGAILEADWFAYENVEYDNNVYSAEISGYTDEKHTNYYNGDLVAFKIPSKNKGKCFLKINDLEKIPIYDENYEVPIDGTNDTMNLESGETYVFKIVCRREKGKNITRAYLLGQYQCHAMCVLTDGTVGEDYTTSAGITVKKYSKEYFQEVYNVNNVYMDVEPTSPFTVQKLGVILNVYDDDSNIQSTSTALETARQENYRCCRLTDNISIVTKLTPYADVNQKVQYTKSDSEEPEEFLINSITHDLAGGTTSWNLVKYYPQYINTEE